MTKSNHPQLRSGCILAAQALRKVVIQRIKTKKSKRCKQIEKSKLSHIIKLSDEEVYRLMSPTLLQNFTVPELRTVAKVIPVHSYTSYLKEELIPMLASQAEDHPEDQQEDISAPEMMRSENLSQTSDRLSLSQRSENLNLIHRLIMLDLYSRPESDRLIELIKSRGVERASQAIEEAQKWVEESNRVTIGSTSEVTAHQSAVTAAAAQANKSETLHLTERLQQYWGKEIDRLADIMKSRGEELASQAIREAKKLVEENRRVTIDSESDEILYAAAQQSAVTPQATEGVDIREHERDLMMQIRDLERQNSDIKADYEVLNKRYESVCEERKFLHNELITCKGNIRVYCRCKPLQASEIANGARLIVNFDSCRDNELKIIKSGLGEKPFEFDYVFRHEAEQEAVFHQISPLVVSVLDGYNVCIMAYGQTGTGKTYTMEGTPQNRGVYYRTMERLFSIRDEQQSTSVKYDILASMMEVYNETIRDLLPAEDPTNPPKTIRFDGTEFQGFEEAVVKNVNDVLKVLETGRSARSVGATNANELSSRSHCILRVTVIEEKAVDGVITRTRSCLWLVDLAGSEGADKTGDDGQRVLEAGKINRSLLTLRNVFSALAKNEKPPYTSSKLTHLLQSSLGGDCKAMLLLHISSNSLDESETISSLTFGRDARSVEMGPARKQKKHIVNDQRQEPKTIGKPSHKKAHGPQTCSKQPGGGGFRSTAQKHPLYHTKGHG